MNTEENLEARTPILNSQIASNPPIKIGKFKASRMIVGESWKILKQDKELAWFPILSAVSSIIALAVMGVLFFFVVLGGDIHAIDNLKESDAQIIGYIMLFIYYLVMFFIANYFLSGIYIIAYGRFNGQDLSFTDGINGANKNIGKIFLWSLISATVGVILNLISNRLKFFGRLISFFLGAAWAILTYFSLPSLIIGQRKVTDAFKESATIIRKTWGETIIVNFSVGLFFGIITFIVLAFSIGIVFLAPLPEVIISVVILFVIFLIAIAIISTTLSSIFKLSLYQFALTGTVPQGFTPDLIRGAIKSGK